jgi:hypothetical protein
MKINMDDPHWVGDMLHVISLLGTFVFAVTVVYEVSTAPTRMLSLTTTTALTNTSSTTHSARFIFDPMWMETGGFCIAHVDKSYGNSHDLCFWVGVVLSLACYGMNVMWRHTPGMSNANTMLQTGIPGVLAHGIMHMAYGQSIRNQYDASLPNENIFLKDSTDLLWYGWLPPLTWIVFVFFLFWLAMLKMIMPHVRMPSIVILSILVIIAQAYMPQIYGFTFTQSVLIVAFGINQLARPVIEKDWAYALFPAFVTIPLLVVGWMESLSCEDWVGPYFLGHVAYDTSIALGMMAWYTTLHWYASSANSSRMQSGSVSLKIKDS